jgi:hypothetical protein
MMGHFQLNKPELLAADGCTSPRGKLRGLLEVEQTVLHAEDAGLVCAAPEGELSHQPAPRSDQPVVVVVAMALAQHTQPESLEEFMVALQGFSVADAIHTNNLGKTKKTTVKEAKKRATESIKLIKQKEKGASLHLLQQLGAPSACLRGRSLSHTQRNRVHSSATKIAEHGRHPVGAGAHLQAWPSTRTPPPPTPRPVRVTRRAHPSHRRACVRALSWQAKSMGNANSIIQ